MFTAKISIKNLESLKSKQNAINNNGFHFVVNNPNKLHKRLSKKLSIQVINYSAQTIKISFKDNNALKTKDIVNTIAREFLKYDVERKQLSAKKILEFIEQQTKKVYYDLNRTEKEIQPLKRKTILKKKQKVLNITRFRF